MGIVTDGSCNQGLVLAGAFPSTSLAVTGLGGALQFGGPRGLADNTGSLIFSLGAKSVTILVNRMGHARLCSSTVPGYSAC